MEIAFACPPHPPNEAFQADLKYLHILQVCVFWQEGVGQPSDEHSLSSRHVVFFFVLHVVRYGWANQSSPLF